MAKLKNRFLQNYWTCLLTQLDALYHCMKGTPVLPSTIQFSKKDVFFLMLLHNHYLAQMFSLIEPVTQVSDVAHGRLVKVIDRFCPCH